MIGRLIAFLLCVVAGGMLGWWVDLERGLAVGLVSGSAAWFVVESVRAAKVLRWITRGGTQPSIGGLWGEAADRVRRAIIAREREAAEANRKLDDFLAAIQASPNGVILLDAQGRIEWCNQTAADQFGLDAQRDQMQHIANLLRDPSFTAYFQQKAYAQEVVVAGPGGSPSRPAKLSVQLHPYGDGRLLLLSRDITALEQAEIMRRDFVANVSHEIRTPLTVLTGFVETLHSLDLPAEERNRYLSLMAQQAQRMQTLVSDLLTLSRLEGSPLPGAGEWIGLGAVTSQAEQEARGLSLALGRNHVLAFKAPPALDISGSAPELQSAVSNLVSNAVRYTPAGGTVDVQWKRLPDERLEFSVRDTGPGIAREHIPRLTERFYRVDRSRSRETGGTGLGLAIVKHVVNRHGAELKIDSTPGQGSTFTITLPASRVRVTPGATNARPATESTAG